MLLALPLLYMYMSNCIGRNSLYACQVTVSFTWTHAYLMCVPNKVTEESGEDEGLGESPAKRARQDDAASSDEEQEGRDPGKQD